MNDFNPKNKSKGLGDTIAKITNATGLDKVADAVAKAAGAEDCGCNKRRKTLNEIFPYTKPTPPKKSTPYRDFDGWADSFSIEGNYEVLQEINVKGIIPDVETLNKGTILTIDKNHPLYSTIKHYYKHKIIKKL